MPPARKVDACPSAGRLAGALLALVVLALPFTLPFVRPPPFAVAADDEPVEPVRLTCRVNGLFAPAMAERLRAVCAEHLPAINVVEADPALGEATFEFDTDVPLYANARRATPEHLLALFNRELRPASRSVFTVRPRRTTPLENLEWIEIPLEGLDCQACALFVHNLLVKIDGVEHATVSFQDGRAMALVDPRKVDQKVLWEPLREQFVGATQHEVDAGIMRDKKIETVWKRWPAGPAGQPPPARPQPAVPADKTAEKPAEKIGFVSIPGGTYRRGNLSGDLDCRHAPVETVSLSGYALAVHPTTKAQWDEVRTWALENGYADLAAGEGRAGDHPVQTVTWYDVVKWCNAASERDGLEPCYTLDDAVYRTGVSDDVACDWRADGYRLPTEAEWEVAARGGLEGKRFPWGDTISHEQANYLAEKGPNLDFDLSGDVNGHHPRFATEGFVYTSPVGSFPANGYGLFDMAGNVAQWCWDWFGPYEGGTDPRGRNTDSFRKAPPFGRILRGGHWNRNAIRGGCRCAMRIVGFPSLAGSHVGFRLARGNAADPPE